MTCETSVKEYEEYLEIDYASEIEASAHYVFSQRPYCRNTAGAACNKELDEERGDGDEVEVSAGEEEGEKNTSRHSRVSLSLLMGEARRRHLLHLRQRGDGEEEIKIIMREWRRLAGRLVRELDDWGDDHVRRSLSTMYLFDLTSELRLGDTAARARELVRNREEVLRRLRECNALFITPVAEEGKEAKVHPLSVVAVTSVAPLQCELLSPSPNTSPKSGGGASSSACSSDTEEDADECRSPPVRNEDPWLSTPCR